MTAQQLKNSILQLAVQGKLVPQDPNDEPACVLLERITKERERLIKEKKIKRPKTISHIFRQDGRYFESVNGDEPVCIDEQIPFDIPDSWEWVRLENLCSYIQRGKSPKYSHIKKYPVIAQKCNQWSGFSIEKAQFIAPETLSSYAEERILQDCDLLWNSTGLGTLGRMSMYEIALNPFGLAVADSHVTVIRPLICYVSSLYLYYYFANPSVQSIIEEQSDGSTKQKELSLSTVKGYLVPLPPKSEQLRINKVIKQLYPVLSEYNTVEQKLATLNKELPILLKKSILQHAIQGKLVPQAPNDEPASKLLERIARERAKLGKKAPSSMSRIERRDRGTYEIFPDGTEKDISGEIPFEIPSSWEWSRLGHVFSLFSTGPFGSMVHKSDYTDLPSGIPLINPTNIKNGCINKSGIQRVKKEKSKNLSVYQLSEGDIILARRGDLSKCAIVKKNEEQWLCGTGSFFLHLSFIVNEYFCYFYTSPYTQGMLHDGSVGTTMVNLNQKLLNNLLFPLPPIQEQHRIVEKIGALMKEIEATK